MITPRCNAPAYSRTPLSQAVPVNPLAQHPKSVAQRNAELEAKVAQLAQALSKVTSDASAKAMVGVSAAEPAVSAATSEAANAAAAEGSTAGAGALMPDSATQPMVAADAALMPVPHAAAARAGRAHHRSFNLTEHAKKAAQSYAPDHIRQQHVVDFHKPAAHVQDEPMMELYTCQGSYEPQEAKEKGCEVINGTLHFRSDAEHESVSLPALKAVTRDVRIAGNKQLKSIMLPKLVAAARVMLYDNSELKQIQMPAFTAGLLQVWGHKKLTDVELPPSVYHRINTKWEYHNSPIKSLVENKFQCYVCWPPTIPAPPTTRLPLLRSSLRSPPSLFGIRLESMESYPFPDPALHPQIWENGDSMKEVPYKCDVKSKEGKEEEAKKYKMRALGLDNLSVHPPHVAQPHAAALKRKPQPQAPTKHIERAAAVKAKDATDVPDLGDIDGDLTADQAAEMAAAEIVGPA